MVKVDSTLTKKKKSRRKEIIEFYWQFFVRPKRKVKNLIARLLM